MNKLKRILALILILCFVLTFAGCGKTETETIKPEEEVKEEAAISFTPGTYTGKGVGFSGEVVIDVTFSEDAITDIKLVSSMETDHVGTPAFDIMFEAIKTHTSTGVDAVSGATLTSNAVLRAVEDAAAQAGCETMSAFHAFPSTSYFEPIIGRSCIYDLAFRIITLWTSHIFLPLLIRYHQAQQ
jgi:uncharacterized protein with FMN-binding domain